MLVVDFREVTSVVDVNLIREPGRFVSFGYPAASCGVSRLTRNEASYGEYNPERLKEVYQWTSVRGTVKLFQMIQGKSLEEALKLEAELGLIVFASKDLPEGLRAQKEIRKPVFK